MGICVARDLKKQDFKIIPIIGDGALTGGMALEALNNIGQTKKSILIILNDNEMSISPNVGALHNHLGRLRTNKGYNRLKHDLEHLLLKIPGIGKRFIKTLERVKDSLKYLVVSGVFFESLGLTYLGPVNGHSFEELFEVFKQACRKEGPVIIHVVTKKGYGYKPAEDDAVLFHGVSPYKIESGLSLAKKENVLTYPDVVGKTLITLAKENEKIVVITPAMLAGSKLDEFSRLFPTRTFDVGIAEQHAVTFAAGLSLSGMKPFVVIYSTFLQRAYDQVIHDVCRQKLNVVFCIDRAGFVGEDGDTHQGLYDIGFLRIIPNIVLCMPKDENELQHMLFTALKHDKGPIAIRYSKKKGLGVALDKSFKVLPLGKWEILTNGNDIAVLAVGTMVSLALEASKKLLEEGIFLKVINCRFLKPLDEEVLDKLAEENMPLITVEEAVVCGGFGSSILEYFAKKQKRLIIKTLGCKDIFIDHGRIEEQLAEASLTINELLLEIKKIRYEVVGEKGKT